MLWLYWLLALVCSLACAWLVFRADKKRDVPYPWLTALLRGLSVLFICVLLFFPAFTLTKNMVEKPLVIHLQDDSRSVELALGADSQLYAQQTNSLLNKLAEKYKIVRLGFGDRVRHDSTLTYNLNATDISGALSHVQEYYGLDNVGAVIVASDGLFNLGTNPLYQQLSLKGSLYTVAIGDSAARKDLRITGVFANRTVSINTSFEIRADITAVLCDGYQQELTLKEGNATVASLPLKVGAPRFDRAVSFIVKAERPGLHHYTLIAPDAGNEKNTTNNRKEIFVEVTETKKKILLAYAAPHPDINAIKEAISGIENYAVTTCSADKLPGSLAGYDAIVLHGLPSARVEISGKLRTANKPVWFIVTAQTNCQSINNMTDLYGCNVMPAGPHDVLPQYNSSFSLFNMPPGIQTVTDNMPPLSVNTGRTSALPAGNAMFIQKGATGANNSLWLLVQGNTNACILAGEGLWRWRLYEFKNYNNHEVIDECIRQTMAFLLAGGHDKPFVADLPKHVWKDNEPVSLRAYLLNANREQVNTPDVSLVITDSTGHKHNYDFEKSGTAWFLNIGIWAGGTYTYKASTVFNGKTYVSDGSFAVESTPVELLGQGADYPLLFGLAKKYNGSFTTYKNQAILYDSISGNNNIKPLIQETVDVIPLVDNKWYFAMIMILLIAEWLLRKYWMAL